MAIEKPVKIEKRGKVLGSARGKRERLTVRGRREKYGTRELRTKIKRGKSSVREAKQTEKKESVHASAESKYEELKKLETVSIKE